MFSPGICAIDGEFGSWKTLNMTRFLIKLSKGSNNIIFTNIKLREPYASLPNIFYYDSVIYEYDKYGDPILDKKGNHKSKFGMLDVLQFISLIDDKMRASKVGRQQRINFFIFEDELGDTYNKNTWKEFPKEAIQFLLQVRKIFVRIFGGVQIYTNCVKQLREHFDWVYYYQPYFDWFKNIGEVRMRKVDPETGETRVQLIPGTDENGNPIKIEKPLDYHFDYLWWGPYRYKFYDDLYVNKSYYIQYKDLLLDYKQSSFYANIKKYIEANSYTDKRTVTEEDLERLEKKSNAIQHSIDN